MGRKESIQIDFPPNFSVRWGHGKPVAKYVEKIFIDNLEKQQEFSTYIDRFMPELEKIDVKTRSSVEPFWNQGWFPPLDGISLYTMLAWKKPSNYIEIGSGNSTKFANRAISDHSLDTCITSIDPHPRAEIDKISNNVVRDGLETVDLSIFDSLKENDVVFFDGSHRCFQNSDVTVFFIDVLPRLKPGVIVGIHDIFWPNDYPEVWVERYYSEQYLLGTYMLAKKDTFPLIFGCNWMAKSHSEYINNLLSNTLSGKIKLAGKIATGGCLWFFSN